MTAAAGQSLAAGFRWRKPFMALVILATVACLGACGQTRPSPREDDKMADIALPRPQSTGPMSLEETLSRRRSHRSFGAGRLSEAQLSQLLWSAQGVTSTDGRRTAPSAGGLYPLELFVVTEAGIFHYQAREHRLQQRARGDRRAELRRVSLDQECVGRAPCIVVLAGVMARTERKYGTQRASRYVYMEAGHAAQNLLLQATSLGLRAVPVGAFDDEGVRTVVGLPTDHSALYLVPVGPP